jgi:integrase
MSQATRLKHLRQAGFLCKKCEEFARQGLAANLGVLKAPVAKAPLVFSDEDFQKLYNAFENCDYPKVIAEPWQRFRFWQTLIHFAAVTAVRRQALLGLTWEHLNLEEMYVTITPDIDKMGKLRQKSLKPELVQQLIELRRFFPKTETKVFPGVHGNKTWYKCWGRAEDAVGKRFHLHDLKRYSGDLLIRAGATVLELQQHMDHANINTTLKHYARAQTKAVVSRMKVPITEANILQEMPLFSEVELQKMLGDIIEREVSRAVSIVSQKLPREQRTNRKRKILVDRDFVRDLLSEESELEEFEEGGGV